MGRLDGGALAFLTKPVSEERLIFMPRRRPREAPTIRAGCGPGLSPPSSKANSSALRQIRSRSCPARHSLFARPALIPPRGACGFQGPRVDRAAAEGRLMTALCDQSRSRQNQRNGCRCDRLVQRRGKRSAAQHEGAEDGGERGYGRSKLESFHVLLASVWYAAQEIHHARNRAVGTTFRPWPDSPVDKSPRAARRPLPGSGQTPNARGELANSSATSVPSGSERARSHWSGWAPWPAQRFLSG